MKPEHVLRAPFVAVDTETTGLRVHDGRDSLMGISIAIGSGPVPESSVYLPVQGTDRPIDPDPWIRAIRDRTGPTLMHHATFDASVLGVWPQYLIDTQVQAWLLNENRPTGLKYLGDRYLGADSSAEAKALRKLMKGWTLAEAKSAARAEGLKGKEAEARARELQAEHGPREWRELRAEELAEYARQDAVLTYRLHHYLSNASDPVGPGISPHELERQCRFQRTLWDMIRTGVALDVEGAAKACERAEEECRTIEEELGINPRSVREKARLLYEEWGLEVPNWTPTGLPATDRATLEMLLPHTGVELLIRHAHLQKAISAFYRPLLDWPGRVHASFSSCRTVTGRLSCSDPNLQTIPREDTLGEVRRCFVAAPGYRLWEVDLAGAELRVMANLTRDPTMCQALSEGRDLHGEMAHRVWGPDATGLHRRAAKAVLFGWTYGAGPRKVATMLPSRSVDEASRLLEALRWTYPAVAQGLRALQDVAKDQGWVAFPSPWEGRVRRFLGSDAPVYAAFNNVVQGAVAELMKDVMMNLDLEDIGARLVLQVHDSLVFEIPDGEADAPDRLRLHLDEVLKDCQPPRWVLPMKWEDKPWL